MGEKLHVTGSHRPKESATRRVVAGGTGRRSYTTALRAKFSMERRNEANQASYARSVLASQREENGQVVSDQNDKTETDKTNE